MVICFKNNKIINPITNTELKNPAVLIDFDEKEPDNTALLSYGEELMILEKYEALKKTYKEKGLEDYSNHFSVIAFNTDNKTLTPEEVAYVLIRMIEYTATSFINEFVYHMKHDTTTEWLKSEMKTAPRNI